MPWDLVSGAYAEEVEPEFAKFADDALDGLPEGTRVLDVGAGPGTLALHAARRKANVTAIDLSPKMIALLTGRAAQEKLAIDARVGDATSLAFEDESFDAAFSMFVLMFVPDRKRAFAEILRVLRRGGRAVVTSWVPLRRADPFFSGAFEAVRTRVPGLPPDDGTAPLGTVESASAEMREAGFGDVTAREVTHSMKPHTVLAFWEAMQRSTAPIVLLKKKLGDGWNAIDRGVRHDLEARFGSEARAVEMTAILTSGARPS